MKNDSVIAMTDGTRECGAIVWWTLRGPVDYEAYQKAWEQAFCSPDLICPPLLPPTAMRRAMRELEERHRLVRGLGKRNHYAVVDETVDGEEIAHSVTCKVRLEDGVPMMEPYLPKVKQTLDAAFEAQMGMLQPVDISWWLINLAHHVEAVTLRERGGIYFIPAGKKLSTWRHMTGVLDEVSDHAIYEVPAMSTGEAVEAILAAVTREAEAEAEAFEQALVADLGARALVNREERCRSVQNKVKNYEALLGASMETLRERLMVLEAQLAAAALTAMGEDVEGYVNA